MEPPSSSPFLFHILQSGELTLFINLILIILLLIVATASGSVASFDIIKAKGKKAVFIAEKQSFINESLILASIVLSVCTAYFTYCLLAIYLSSINNLYLTFSLVGILIALLIVCLFLKRCGKNTPKLAITFYPFIKFFWFLFYPFVSILFPRAKKSVENTESENETENGEDSAMFQALENTVDTEVKEILSSRMDITTVDISMDFDDLMDVVIDSGYSRLPVYEEDFDHVKGILYIKDLLPYIRSNKDFEWQELIHEAYFVPEHKKINALLDEMKRKKIHMAIVVDEYGGTTGIVTLEDILEEIVGEILDESDVEAEETFYVKLKDGSYSFEGKTPLIDFCRTMQVDNELFDSTKGDAETLAGLLLELKGEFLKKGEEITIPGFTFKVESADDRRIRRIRVIKNEE